MGIVCPQAGVATQPFLLSNRRAVASNCLLEAELKVLEQKIVGNRRTLFVRSHFFALLPYVKTSTVVTTITQNQPLEVNISIPIEDALKLRLGMPVELKDWQGRAVGTSKVFFIAPRTNNNTQSVLIKSLFDNSNNQLRTNQYVLAQVIWGPHPGILVPATAVSRIGGQSFVFVAQPQAPQQGQAKQEQAQLVARQKPVELGEIRGNNYQVISGLKPGEKLVVSNILSLSDGAPVVPE